MSNSLPVSDLDHAAYQSALYQAVYEEHGISAEEFFVPSLFVDENDPNFARKVAERMFELRRNPDEMESIRAQLSQITVGEWIDSPKT
jgi:hypothetical protein